MSYMCIKLNTYKYIMQFAIKKTTTSEHVSTVGSIMFPPLCFAQTRKATCRKMQESEQYGNVLQRDVLPFLLNHLKLRGTFLPRHRSVMTQTGSCNFPQKCQDHLVLRTVTLPYLVRRKIKKHKNTSKTDSNGSIRLVQQSATVLVHLFNHQLSWDIGRTTGAVVNSAPTQRTGAASSVFFSSGLASRSFAKSTQNMRSKNPGWSGNGEIRFMQ